MPIKVVDASALGALAFGEPEATAVAEALEDATLAAPSLLWFEMASICRKKIVAHPEIRQQLLAAFGRARRLPIGISEVDHEKIVVLAEETGLTTYDASYLWLTSTLHGELVTLDKELKKVALTIIEG
jgi:predicted nucleic acid-binding protein